MLIQRMTGKCFCIAAFATVTALAGCSKEKAPTETPKAVAAVAAVETPVAVLATPAALVEAQPAVTAMLAKADAADGTTDKIVSKCAGCKLRMDGSEQHEFSVSGYKMRFCSEDCKGRFQKDAPKSILALDISGD